MINSPWDIWLYEIQYLNESCSFHVSPLYYIHPLGLSTRYLFLVEHANCSCKFYSNMTGRYWIFNSSFLNKSLWGFKLDQYSKAASEKYILIHMVHMTVVSMEIIINYCVNDQIITFHKWDLALSPLNLHLLLFKSHSSILSQLVWVHIHWSVYHFSLTRKSRGLILPTEKKNYKKLTKTCIHSQLCSITHTIRGEKPKQIKT